MSASFPIPAAAARCSVEGCEKRHMARGLCAAHYYHLRKRGDPLGGGRTPGYAGAWIREHKGYSAPECLQWPFGKDRHGYGRVFYNGRMQGAHHVMCELVNGPAPSTQHDAAHSCGRGDKGCCSPQHLSWKTRAENEADKVAHGTSNRGERQGASKLTRENVLTIRAARGVRSQSDLGREFGVHQSTIKDIQLRKRWAWL